MIRNYCGSSFNKVGFHNCITSWRLASRIEPALSKVDRVDRAAEKLAGLSSKNGATQHNAPPDIHGSHSEYCPWPFQRVRVGDQVERHGHAGKRCPCADAASQRALEKGDQLGHQEDSEGLPENIAQTGVSATPDDCFHLSIDIVREIHAEALEKFDGLKGVRDENLLASAVLAIELRRQITLPRYRGGSSGVFVVHLPQSSVSRWEQADRDDGGDRLPEVEWNRAGTGQRTLGATNA